MAGEISAIVQITAASWKAVDKTIQFIREMRVIDKSVERLVKTLQRLQEVITLVARTCDQSGGNATNRALVFIRATLSTCDQSLAEVVELVKRLAAQKSDTFFQKFTLKVRSDWWKPDIDAAIKDIILLVNNLNTGINCWTLDIVVAEHEISKALAAGSPFRLHQELQRIMRDEQRVDSVLSRTFSGGTTINDQDAASPTGAPASTSLPITNATAEDTSTQKELTPEPEHGDERTRFHYQVTKCNSQEEQITRIWSILSKHPKGSVLATSIDDAGRSPLHLAAENNDVELARVLVNFAADINAQDCEPASVLDFAVANNCEEFVQFLLEEGADETKVSEKNQPRFKELQQMIEARKTHKAKQSKVPTRTQSLTPPRKLSIRARYRTGSVK